MAPALWQVLVLSLKVAATATAVILIPGIGAGWLLARRQFRGKLVLDTLINLPLVLPPVVTGYFLLLLFGRNGPAGRLVQALTGWTFAFTWQAAAVAAAVVAFPLFVRAVRVAIENIDPKLEQAAGVLRATGWQVFRTITLPLALNGIVAGALLAFARSLGEFGATIMVAGNIPGKTQTIPLAIFSQVNQPGGEVMVGWLVGLSVAIAYGSLILSELILRRTGAGGHGN